MIDTSFLIGFSVILSLAFMGYGLFKATTVVVEDEHEVLIINYGKLTCRLSKPGLHFVFEKVWPWVQTFSVSKQMDFRTFKNIHVNDRFGTTLVLDLWLEFKIVDPYKTYFCVENWEESLKSLVTHATTSILSSQNVSEILMQRTDLGMQLQGVLQAETQRWGIQLNAAMIQNIQLLPEISKQFFASVAAKIERTKALIEEEARLRVAKLEAETSHRVAELNTSAKIQLPLAISNAYREISGRPEVLKAFQEFWDLRHLDPRKTVAIEKLNPQSMTAMEATMTVQSYLTQ